MTSLVSPGVQVREIDLTTIVPSVSTTEGAIAGVFRWGPIGQRIMVDSESILVSRFQKPTNLNAETFFTAASFLGYGNRLFVSRAANTSGTSPQVTATVVAANSTVVLSTGNTSDLSTGMIVISSANSGLSNGAVIGSIVNSTAFTLSSSSGAIANSTSDLIQFVTNTAMAAVANTGVVANLQYQTVLNETDFTTKEDTFDLDVPLVARFAGDIGNSLRVSICANAAGFESTINLASASYGGTIGFNINVNSNSTLVTIQGANVAQATSSALALKSELSVTDVIEVGNTEIGTQFMRITDISNTSLSGSNATFTLSFEDPYKLSANVQFSSNSSVGLQSFDRKWEFHALVDAVPGLSDYQRQFGNNAVNSDEMHIVVVDDKGSFTGQPGTILEVHRALSRATDAKTIDGAANYWKTVINDASQYIWAVNDISGAESATALNLTNSTLDTISLQFQYGRDGKDESNIELSVLTRAYDLYQNKENVDISLILQGKARSYQLANYLIDNIAEPRMDCIVLVSPQKGDVVNNVGNEADAVVNFRNNLRSTSYGVLDSGYKYMYDRYNDVYRWIPLNGDTAGLCVRTDNTNDPWWSPAGFNRGQVKNLVKLAFNPRQSERDTLYKAGVNPVVTFPGRGTILYGDKTLLAKPSAFDRINVRRLFIVLEKAISKAAEYTLFEFNDTFTRAQFRAMVVPYLRDVQGRRGITDFLVKCDETNNTPEVIDRNEFIGDIYIKPARSINFISLNFVAVRTGVSFSEVVGQF